MTLISSVLRAERAGSYVFKFCLFAYILAQLNKKEKTSE